MSRCRICLRCSRNTVPLFMARIGDKSITDLIFELFQIAFVRDAGYPRRVCELCVKKLHYLHSFYKDLLKSQALLQQLKEANTYMDKRQLISDEGPTNYSDGLLDEVDKLEEVLVEEKEEEYLEEYGIPEGEETGQSLVENVEIEAVGFDEDRPVEEQLIDIKIEAVVEEEKGFQSEGEQEEFKGFEEPAPAKPVASTNAETKKMKRKPKYSVPKLEIVETIPNKCYICSEILENKDLFDVHLITHSNMLPYKCEDCSTTQAPVEIKTIVMLNKHFETHGFSYVCEFCPLRFRSYPPLYDHTRNFHAEHSEGFNCDMCGRVFAEIRKFQKHVRAHRNCDAERYKCKTCGKTFQTGTILRRHEHIHKSEPLFTCTVCQRNFNNQEQFHKHKLRHLQQQYDQQNGYTCSHCEKHFTCKVDLRVHMHEHFPNNPNYSVHSDVLPSSLKDSSSYPRSCEEPDCNYVAPTYALMWSHYRKHYKMYQCEECNRKFATATILKTHVDVIHKKIRKYCCEICGKSFAYQHKYKEHMNVHQGVRDRKCRFCSKTFTHFSNLLVHEKIHKNIKAHRCDVCDSTYVTSSALKKHKKTHLTHADMTLETKCDVSRPEIIVADHVDEDYNEFEQLAGETVKEELVYFAQGEDEIEIGGEVIVKELCEALDEV